jgi:hypothetical protein
MTDTIESLRARIAEVERERDEANASAVNAYTEACAARADAARLAEALRRERNVIAEWHPDAEDPASMVLVRIDEALAAHDAGTPTGGVWLTAEEAEESALVLSDILSSEVISDDMEARAIVARNLLRKARGGGA